MSSRGKDWEGVVGSEESISFSLWRFVTVKCFQKGGGAGKGALGKVGSILQRKFKLEDFESPRGWLGAISNVRRCA